MSQLFIDYYFWLNSDWAYLGADRLSDISSRFDLEINYKPVDLPDVYSRTGGVLLGERSNERQEYRVTELNRWCRKLNIHVNPNPAYMCPNADLASCIVIAADRSGIDVHELYKAILRAEWCEDRDISSASTLKDIIESCTLNATDLLDMAQSPEIISTYRSYTDEAVQVGVFGSPTYVFEGELFWGQDRLDMLVDAIESRNNHQVSRFNCS